MRTGLSVNFPDQQGIPGNLVSSACCKPSPSSRKMRFFAGFLTRIPWISEQGILIVNHGIRIPDLGPIRERLRRMRIGRCAVACGISGSVEIKAIRDFTIGQVRVSRF